MQVQDCEATNGHKYAQRSNKPVICMQRSQHMFLLEPLLYNLKNTFIFLIAWDYRISCEEEGEKKSACASQDSH